LREIPYIGSIRAALLIAWLQTPHRFRTKRQLWAYSGLAVEVHSSGDYHFAQGQLQRTRKANSVRGLTSPRAIIAAGFFLFAMAVKYLVAPVGQILA
jgi:transposase